MLKPTTNNNKTKQNKKSSSFELADDDMSKQQASKLAEGEAALNEGSKAASKGIFKKPGLRVESRLWTDWLTD